MSFLLSSHSISQQGTRILATCRRPDGTESHSSLQLDDYLGNTNGNFDVNSTDFYDRAFKPFLQSQRIFEADLAQGDSELYVCRTYDLSLSLVNNGGDLDFVKPYVDKNFSSESCITTPHQFTEV